MIFPSRGEERAPHLLTHELNPIVVEAGDIDPETVVTPGIFVDRILDLSAVSVGTHTSEVAS